MWRWWTSCQLYLLMIKRLFLSCLGGKNIFYSPKSLCVCLVFSQFLQDLEGKIIVDELRQEVISTNSKAEPPQCTCLAWSADGQVCACFSTDVKKWSSPVIIPIHFKFWCTLVTVLQIWGATFFFFVNIMPFHIHINMSFLPFICACVCTQTLFAGYTDNQIRVWQVTIGTR